LSPALSATMPSPTAPSGMMVSAVAPAPASTLMLVAEERNQGGDGEENMAGEAPRGVNRGRADDDEGGDGDSQPQIIPSRGLNEWLLLGVLEDTFEPNKFKIEVSDVLSILACLVCLVPAVTFGAGQAPACLSDSGVDGVLTLRQMRSDSYKVWAPRRLGSQELQRCRSKGTK
jgi:hypothetical protein